MSRFSSDKPFADARSTRSPYGDFAPIARLRQEINELFENGIRSFWGDDDGLSGFTPAVDVDQHEDHYEVSIELPGCAREHVSVEVAGDELVVIGTKREQSRSEGAEKAQSSRRYGRFEQRMKLPADADRDSISAGFEDGVLTIRVPRTAVADARGRRIEIESSSVSQTPPGQGDTSK